MHEKELELRSVLGRTDMYLIDLLQKGYFSKPLRVLDVGCGSGRNIWFLATIGHKITAVDANSGTISVLKSEIKHKGFTNITARVGELGELGHRIGKFDFIICNAVLHFASDRLHFKKMFLEVVSKLQPEGVGFCRFVSSHTFNSSLGPFNIKRPLPDGSSRFVVDINWFKESFISTRIIQLVEPLKTVNVDDIRTMTTVIFKPK